MTECRKYSIKKSILSSQHYFVEPTFILRHVYLGCTQRQYEKKAKILLTNIEPCLNPEFLQEQQRKIPCSKKLRIFSRSYDMGGHAKKCVEGYCELANRRLNNSTKCELHALMTINHFKEEEFRGRIVKSVLSNCSEKLVFGTCWTTR